MTGVTNVIAQYSTIIDLITERNITTKFKAVHKICHFRFETQKSLILTIFGKKILTSATNSDVIPLFCNYLTYVVENILAKFH